MVSAEGVRSGPDFETSVPVHFPTPGEALSALIESAASERRGLAIIAGTWIPSSDLLDSLSAASSRDPLLGCIQPRFAVEDGGILPLPSESMERPRPFPRAALLLLPEFCIAPELQAPCMVLTRAAVLAVRSQIAGSFVESLTEILVGLRRRGFRTLVMNRLVAEGAPVEAGPCPDVLPVTSVDDRYPDIARSRAWAGTMPQAKFERILSGAFRNGRPRMLLDCRAMHDVHNGTAHAILGFLDGLASLPDTGWDIDIVCWEHAAIFHRVTERYPQLSFHYNQPHGFYVLVAHLAQPWGVGTLVDLHRQSILLVFNILDTISWDIIFAASDGLGDVWRATAEWSDGLLFDSHFTMDRFAFRFPSPPHVRRMVTHLSLASEEWAAASPSGDDDPFLLVVGNHYDHKDVTGTALVLADAYPSMRVVALGGTVADRPNLVAMSSGHVSEEDVLGLFAHASVIIFPSFYEGFGLPVAQGLARGKTVVVRSSPLWVEIAGNSRMPGQMIAFEDDAEMIGAVGRALRSELASALVQGALLHPGEDPPSWRECTARLFRLADDLLDGLDGAAWFRRDAALSLYRE
jgi:glycosyltransferase involved in cell wall biosynthesis